MEHFVRGLCTRLHFKCLRPLQKSIQTSEQLKAKNPLYSDATPSVMAYEILYIFCGLKSLIFTLICMWDNVSMPISHVASQIRYYPANIQLLHERFKVKCPWELA